MLNYNNPEKYQTKTGVMNALSNHLANTLGYSLSVTNSNAAVTSGSAVYWIHSVGSKYVALWTYNGGNADSNPTSSSLMGNGFVALNSISNFSGTETNWNYNDFSNAVKAANGTSTLTNYIGNQMYGGTWNSSYGGLIFSDSATGFVGCSYGQKSISSFYQCGFIMDKKDDKLMIVSDVLGSYSTLKYLCIDNNSNVWWGRLVAIGLESRGDGIMLQGFNRCFNINYNDSSSNGIYDYAGYNIFADSRLFMVAAPSTIYSSHDHLIGLSDGSLYYRLGRFFAYQIST